MKKHIIISILIISIFGCRTAKTEWVKENFTEKTEITSLKESITNEIKKQETSLKETIDSKYNEVLSQSTSNSKESENESTNVTGTITAEEGKEKSVTIGGTTIKSNGANISFETSSSKSISKEFESRYQDLSRQLTEEKNTIQLLESKLTLLENSLSEFTADYNSKKDTKDRVVKKTGFQLGIWIIVAIILIAIVALWYFKNQIPPFLNKLTS